MTRRRLTPEEKATSNRESWARSRARTGNWSSRAYNLAIQDAARWVREHKPELWEELYQARCVEQKARVEGDGDIEECPHKVLNVVENVHMLQCAECHQFRGATPAGVAPEGYTVFTGDGGRVAYRRKRSRKKAS